MDRVMLRALREVTSRSAETAWHCCLCEVNLCAPLLSGVVPPDTWCVPRLQTSTRERQESRRPLMPSSCSVRHSRLWLPTALPRVGSQVVPSI